MGDDGAVVAKQEPAAVVVPKQESAAVVVVDDGYYFPPKYPIRPKKIRQKRQEKGNQRKKRQEKGTPPAVRREKRTKKHLRRRYLPATHIVEIRQVDEHGIFSNGRLATLKYLQENDFLPKKSKMEDNEIGEHMDEEVDEAVYLNHMQKLANISSVCK